MMLEFKVVLNLIKAVKFNLAGDWFDLAGKTDRSLTIFEVNFVKVSKRNFASF